MNHRFTAVASLLVFGVVACGDDSAEPSGTAASTGSAVSTGAGLASSSSGSPGSGGDAATGGGSSSSGGAGGSGGSSGSGGAGPHDDEFRSGTRLRAVYLDGGGSAQQQTGWFDTELGVDCGPIELDGELRCLPVYQNVVFFRDAACTEPLIAADGCEVPEHASRFVQEDCEVTYSAYRAVGPVETVDQVYQDYGGGCAARSPETVDVRPAELAPADAFVAFDVAREELDDEVARETITSDDGAFGVYHAIDLARDEACSLQVPAPADGARICAPTFNVRQESNVAYWAEATCTEAALSGSDCTVLASTYPILDVVDLECGERSGTLHQRGEILDSVWESFGNGPECLEQPEVVRGVALGAAFAAGSLPELDTVEHEGNELTLALDARAERAVGGGSWRDGSGGGCRPTATVDGDWRCVPSGSESESESMYADAACTQRLERVQPGECEVPAFVLTYDTELACGESRLAAAHELGVIHEETIYELDDGGACTEYTSSGRFALVGAEVALDAFPLVERIVD